MKISNSTFIQASSVSVAEKLAEEVDSSSDEEEGEIELFLASLASYRGSKYLLPPIPIIPSFTSSQDSASAAESEKTIRDDTYRDDSDEPAESNALVKIGAKSLSPAPEQTFHPPRTIEGIFTTHYGTSTVAKTTFGVHALLARSFIFTSDLHMHLLHDVERAKLSKHICTLVYSDRHHPPAELSTCKDREIWAEMMQKYCLDGSEGADNYLPLLFGHFLRVFDGQLNFDYEEAYNIYIWAPLIDSAFHGMFNVIRGEVPANCLMEKHGRGNAQGIKRHDCLFRIRGNGVELAVIEVKRRMEDVTDWVKVVTLLRDMLSAVCRRDRKSVV